MHYQVTKALLGWLDGEVARNTKPDTNADYLAALIAARSVLANLVRFW